MKKLLLALMGLLLVGCTGAHVTPADWGIAEKDCDANGGIVSVEYSMWNDPTAYCSNGASFTYEHKHGN